MSDYVLGIVRKSPTKSPEVSVEDQKRRIEATWKRDLEGGLVKSREIVWAVDVCKGDDEEGRKELIQCLLFPPEGGFERAYCLNVDRFSRSWLGIKWLHEYFAGGCQLHFVEGLPGLYDDKGNVDPHNYLFFFIQCGFAQYELLRIRSRTRAGRTKLKKNPEVWALKYPGRKKGAKNRRHKRG